MNEQYRRAFHPQRGVKFVTRLKPGWVWLPDNQPTPTAKPLIKPRVRARQIKP